MEKEATYKEPETKEDKTGEIVRERGKGTTENINRIDVIDKEELLRGIGGTICCKG